MVLADSLRHSTIDITALDIKPFPPKYILHQDIRKDLYLVDFSLKNSGVPKSGRVRISKGRK